MTAAKTSFSSSRCLLFTLQRRFCHVLAEEGGIRPEVHPKMSLLFDARKATNMVDMKNWKILDSRTFGIDSSVVPSSSMTVLKILRSRGFDAYLVGGCVRDLLLSKTPKDFDVITTANLNQIKKQFHRAIIVGQRFPICRVQIRGSVTEVSSFETVAKQDEEKEELKFSDAPQGCKKKDFILWRNSLKRDFTINGLFFDPYLNKIYDYANGMSDLRSLKLRTLIPAKVSFEEDCARILRGLRIAARLGLSFSKDTEAAIHDLSSSILTLAKARIMMEVNYMLSYGAAEPSFCLLQKFNLLKILLPVHAAYLEQQASKKSDQNSLMLMKLFSNLDKVVSCDRPSDCRLWVGLLAFHLALVHNPQNAFVVLAFASILYHGDWKEGIRFAREDAQVKADYAPELLRSFTLESDEQLAEEISQLATFVKDSIDVLIDTECLFEAMSSYPTSPCSGLVFVSKKVGQDVAVVFELLEKSIGCYEKRRENFGIDYHLLGKGYLWETRFVLGKVILETMGCATFQREADAVHKVNDDSCISSMDEICDMQLSDLVKKELLRKDRKPSGLIDASEVKQQLAKKRKLNVSDCSLYGWETTPEKQWLIERGTCQAIAKKQQRVNGTNQLHKSELISVLGNMLEKTRQATDNELIEEKKEKAKMNMCNSEDQRPLMMVEKQDMLEEDEGVNEKKEGEVKKKKRKDKDQRPLTMVEKHSISEDEEVIENKDSKKKKKRKSQKDQRPLLVEEKHHVVQDEEVIEKKKEDVKKKKHKSREDKRRLPSTVVEKHYHKLQDVNIVEKMEGDVKKNCKSKERPAEVVEIEKANLMPEENEVDLQRVVVGVKLKGKHKKVAGKVNGSSRILLSDLFK